MKNIGIRTQRGNYQGSRYRGGNSSGYKGGNIIDPDIVGEMFWIWIQWGKIRDPDTEGQGEILGIQKRMDNRENIRFRWH